MPTALDPFRFLLIALAGWRNERLLQMIEYLREENRVLGEQLGDGRLRLTDHQRRRLAAKARGLGRKVLADLATIVTPEALFRWHRQLIAQRYDGSGKSSRGRSRTEVDIEQLVVRMAQENRNWGTGGFRAHYRTWDINWPGALSQTFWNGTASNRHGTQSEDYVERISDATLGS